MHLEGSTHRTLSKRLSRYFDHCHAFAPCLRSNVVSAHDGHLRRKEGKKSATYSMTTAFSVFVGSKSPAFISEILTDGKDRIWCDEFLDCCCYVAAAAAAAAQP